MRAVLQRCLWMMIELPGDGVIAAETERGLPQSAVKIEHSSDGEVAHIDASLARALAQLRVKRRQQK